jgi:hypothetical protein
MTRWVHIVALGYRAPFAVDWCDLDASGAECVAWHRDERFGAVVDDRCGPRRRGDPAAGARRIAAAAPSGEALTPRPAGQTSPRYRTTAGNSAARQCRRQRRRVGRPRRRPATPGQRLTTAAEIDGSGCAGPEKPEREQPSKWACLPPVPTGWSTGSCAPDMELRHRGPGPERVIGDPSIWNAEPRAARPRPNTGATDHRQWGRSLLRAPDGRRCGKHRSRAAATGFAWWSRAGPAAGSARRRVARRPWPGRCRPGSGGGCRRDLLLVPRPRSGLPANAPLSPLRDGAPRCPKRQPALSDSGSGVAVRPRGVIDKGRPAQVRPAMPAGSAFGLPARAALRLDLGIDGRCRNI